MGGFPIYHRGGIHKNTVVLIKAGIIQYHDRNAGYTYIPDPKYYLQSQDPVRWDIILLVVVIFFFVFAFKALQFHGIAKLLGLKTNLGQNLRAYCYSLSWNKVAPFGFGNTAAALALKDEGVPLARAKSVVFIQGLFDIFEIMVFGFVGLAIFGWSEWFAQLFWALFILGLAYGLVRRTYPETEDTGGIRNFAERARQGVRLVASQPITAVWLGFLSLAAFELQDGALYFIAQGFTATHVFIMPDYNTTLMAIIAFHIARLIRFTPGGIGQSEWALAAAMYVGGMGFPESMTIAMLHLGVRLFSAGNFHFLVTNGWEGAVKTTLAEILAAFRRSENKAEPKDQLGASVEDDAPADFPPVPLERAPYAFALWERFAVYGLIFTGLFFLDRLSIVLLDKWFLEAVGHESVFWTNFGMGAKLFVVGFLMTAVSVAMPAFMNPITARQRRFIINLALIAGSVGAYFLCLEYRDFLLFGGKDFGETDPVFGKDLGFYVYELSNYWTIWYALLFGTTAGVLSAIGCSYMVWTNEGRVLSSKGLSRLWQLTGHLATRPVLIPLAVWGVILAAGEWLSRYSILLKANEKHVIKQGATYLDTEGLFSNLNYIYVTMLVILGITVAVVMYLNNLNRVAGDAQPSEDWRKGQVRLRNLVFLLILVDFGFKGLVGIKGNIYVRPNEPVIQLDHIRNHIEATRKGYDLNKITQAEFIPNWHGDPVPPPEEILNSPTVRNAPLWPGFTSYLEAQLDPQHSLRILKTQGDKIIYGPTEEILWQQQKLRAYYNFLGIDSVRYAINGEKKMLFSAIREVPLVEPQPWLAWWGQQYMLFTHGFGLVMGEAGQSTAEGDPVYVSKNIPVETAHDALKAENPRVYYGEGSGTIAYTNVKSMKELDYPTDQDRAEFILPPGDGTGVHINSLIKRLAFGWESGQFFDVVFSGLITDETRVHYNRVPVERLNRIAPFLYYDTNGHAFANGDRITWVLNGLTTSNAYPNSWMGDLGDKSDERTRYPRPHRWANYIEDSVKATVDAYSGEVKFYKISDSPLIETWSKIYPGLFTDGKEMPAEVRSQITYPVQFFHVQFDDIYIYYQMRDPMYFFNMEDMMDDADEVLGPIMDNGKAITFSAEPINYLLETGGALPESSEKVQYSLMMPFTGEKALNLRGLPIAYQDGDDYGKITMLMVPKGRFFPGPEQADAAIDQNPDISRQLSWWNRMGADVIRGHTMPLIVGREVIYIEPIFLRSQQNRTTQMKAVAAVFRGHARLGPTLEDAIRAAVKAASEEPAPAMNH